MTPAQKTLALVGLLSCAACGAESNGEALTEHDGVEIAEHTQKLAGGTFGTLCQQDFQNAWQTTLPEMWTICSRFTNDFDDTTGRAFYFDMNGAESDFEDWGDSDIGGGLDSVDLAFTSTHGWLSGDWAAHAWTMWNQGAWADSSAMRLGDDSRQLKIFANYSCNVMGGDSFHNRWQPTFAGGLRIAASAHGLVWFGSTWANVGKRFSDNLQAGQTVKSAWSNASDTSDNGNNPAVMATGTNSTQCNDRRDNITWGNVVSSYGRIVDSHSITCRSRWTNI